MCSVYIPLNVKRQNLKNDPTTVVRAVSIGVRCGAVWRPPGAVSRPRLSHPQTVGVAKFKVTFCYLIFVGAFFCSKVNGKAGAGNNLLECCKHSNKHRIE